MPTKNTYIDLFAGCGGLSLGLNQSGWKGLFAIEKSPYAFATLKHNLIDKLNHFDWPEWLEKTQHDIDEVLKRKTKELKELRGNVDLVAGGPPCQGFSTAGRREESDHRNELINSYIQFIRLVQPKIIFFENVKGFTQRFEKNRSKGIKYSEFVQKALRHSGKDFKGYQVYGELIDFSEFGVPQKRTRFILVGIRKDIFEKSHFKPSHFFELIKSKRESFLVSKGLGLTQSLQDAISDLLEKNGTADCPDSIGFLSSVYSKVQSPYQKLMRLKVSSKSVPDSHRLANHRKETISLFQTLISRAPKGKKIEGKEREKYNIKKRGIVVLDPDKPAPTLTSHPDDYVHYCEPRILSVREYARIQTFPDWFEFKEKYTTGGKLRIVEVPRYTQVGNAIPPLFGEQAGLALKQILNG
ncbi:DNA cytosine methyltransferase [Sphingobacteriales bacterium UPWRP_1]|nr:DNA (cytosine-5-)-methyltransferase [Sphingobacteriales bacterium TSM_CSM]PSJ73597.1 DNA cytosine methyltransferase [Sphingobacteriales bacterium UPWRP_1]